MNGSKRPKSQNISQIGDFEQHSVEFSSASKKGRQQSDCSGSS